MSEPQDNLVKLTIDGHEVSVPKGTNIIEAANQLKIEIPSYCYHPSLSIVGNCRMCQVEVEGAPKLMIGCHTQVQPDMVVKTHLTSQKVKDAQAATLEFILINHPLDCTVCDQAGHCKLQDFHFEYNAKPSRFIENKVKKVKAEPLGPTVMLDGERCIMCTRCIRFCDEVTKTGELGMVNRGDRSMIAINPGKELNNPFSGTVVDLCPVGALTHRNWRFNTRIWYTKQTDSICPGCSTGCNVKVATRDGQIVQVKARRNDDVNQEWLCDEGRYGVDRFIAKNPISNTDLNSSLEQLKPLKDQKNLFFLSPDLLLEDFYLIKLFVKEFCPESKLAVAYRKRDLTELEEILISPDYAANYKSAEYLDLISSDPEKDYQEALNSIADYEQVLFIGAKAVLAEDLSQSFLDQIKSKKLSAHFSDDHNQITDTCQYVLATRSILQKSGLLINSNGRVQYSDRVLDFQPGTHPEWRVINYLAKLFGKELTSALDDRAITLDLLGKDVFSTQTSISDLKSNGLRV